MQIYYMYKTSLSKWNKKLTFVIYNYHACFF